MKMILTTFTSLQTCQANADKTTDAKDVDDFALLTSKYFFCRDTNANFYKITEAQMKKMTLTIVSRWQTNISFALKCTKPLL